MCVSILGSLCTPAHSTPFVLTRFFAVKVDVQVNSDPPSRSNSWFVKQGPPVLDPQKGIGHGFYLPARLGGL